MYLSKRGLRDKYPVNSLRIDMTNYELYNQTGQQIYWTKHPGGIDVLHSAQISKKKNLKRIF